MKLVLKVSKITNVVFSVFLALYLLCGFFLLFAPANLKSIGASLLLLSGVVISLFVVWSDKISITKYIMFIIYMCLFYILIQIINFRSPFSVLYPMCNLLIGYIVSVKKINLSFLYIAFAVISLVLLHFMIRGDNPNLIFEGSSRNLISVVMLFNSVLIYFQELKQQKTLSLFPAFFTCIFSVWAIGRSGIICSIFLLLIVLYYQLKQQKIIYRILFALLLFVLFFFIIKTRLFEDLNMFEFFIRFEERGVTYDEDERKLMLDMYLAEMDVASFLKGYNYFNDSRFLEWEYNVHNSLISCHALWGVGTLFFFVYLVKKILFMFKKDRFLFFLVIVFCVRIFSDAVCFNGIYDFIIISILFYSSIKMKYGKI